jgi:uncharacterized protein (TIGR00730 family)
MKRLCVYCGSSSGSRTDYIEAARRLGQLMAEQGIGLVYGGGRVGLMGKLADAVLAAGGEVIGVIPSALMAREVGHTGLKDLRVVGSMHERKALMVELADGFVALPGGIGTMDELFEVWTWAQLGSHRKPCGMLDVAGYYAPLLGFLDHMVAQGFLRTEHRRMLVVDQDPQALLARMRSYVAPMTVKWITPSET